jgi:hypothetical protein
MMVDKWYNSIFANATGIGVLFLGLGLGFGSCSYLGSKGLQPEISQPALSSGDLNRNGKPESFYTIEGRVAVIEVDGEPIVDFLKKH